MSRRLRGDAGALAPAVPVLAFVLLLLGGLVIDASRLLNARGRAVAYAEEAARAGAGAIQPGQAVLADLPVEAEAPAKLPEAPLVPIETAYETACRHLRRLVADEAARQQVRVAQRFAVEFARISDYYGQVIAELGRRRARELRRAAGGTQSRGTPGSHEPDDARPGAGEACVAVPAPPSDSLSQKIESAQRERERKLRELGENYGIRVRARLSSARCLWQPKAFFKVLIDRGATTRTLVLAYDGLLERLELPTCESCGQETGRLWASASARLVCPACTGGMKGDGTP